MIKNTVADIVVGAHDFAGAQVLTIYSKVSNTYAVYATPDRVMVQFADDDALGRDQRLALSPLNPLRGEINGLIDGWRGSADGGSKRQALVKLFDRRTADAIVVALQGDQEHAEKLLTDLRNDVLEERISVGRVEYLIVASVCTAVAFAIFLAGYGISIWAFGSGTGSSGADTWLAVGFGCLGALFSIALGIRSREIKPDLQRRDNVSDAVLRIGIGVISAVILFSLFKSNLVSLSIGEAPIALGGADGNAPANSSDVKLHLAIVIAFLAGFSERLVGDVLSKATLAGPAAPAQSAGSGARPDGGAKGAANEKDPLGNKAKAGTAPEPPEEPPEAHVHADAGEDTCVCGVTLKPDEVTDDVELPEADGGVAKAA